MYLRVQTVYYSFLAGPDETCFFLVIKQIYYMLVVKIYCMSVLQQKKKHINVYKVIGASVLEFGTQSHQGGWHLNDHNWRIEVLAIKKKQTRMYNKVSKNWCVFYFVFRVNWLSFLFFTPTNDFFCQNIPHLRRSTTIFQRNGATWHHYFSPHRCIT